MLNSKRSWKVECGDVASVLNRLWVESEFCDQHRLLLKLEPSGLAKDEKLQIETVSFAMESTLEPSSNSEEPYPHPKINTRQIYNGFCEAVVWIIVTILNVSFFNAVVHVQYNIDRKESNRIVQISTVTGPVHLAHARFGDIH